MVNSPAVVLMSSAEKYTALFSKKKVYGKLKFYPKNELAQYLVDFKRVAAQQNRKLIIKCLSVPEIEAAQLLGITIVVMEKTEKTE